MYSDDPRDDPWTESTTLRQAEYVPDTRTSRWVWIVCAIAGLAIVLALILAILAVEKSGEPVPSAPATTSSVLPSPSAVPPSEPSGVTTVTETTVITATPTQPVRKCPAWLHPRWCEEHR